MRITAETRDGIAILKISGRIVFDESLFLMRGHVQKALESGIRCFVLDISEVPHLDSSGCGELISVYSSIAKARGSLAIVNPGERVRLLLQRIGVTEILRIVDTLEEAERLVRPQ
jgi:anti-anti-sigma factor